MTYSFQCSCQCSCAIFFSFTIPDAYDFGQLLLGFLILWGVAATSYRGTHIAVDLLWANCNKLWQGIMDIFAPLVLLFVVSVQTSTLFDKVQTLRVKRRDIRHAISGLAILPIAWMGDVAAVLLIAVRTYRLIFHPELLQPIHEPTKSGE